MAISGFHLYWLLIVNMQLLCLSIENARFSIFLALNLRTISWLLWNAFTLNFLRYHEWPFRGSSKRTPDYQCTWHGLFITWLACSRHLPFSVHPHPFMTQLVPSYGNDWLSLLMRETLRILGMPSSSVDGTSASSLISAMSCNQSSTMS